MALKRGREKNQSTHGFRSWRPKISECAECHSVEVMKVITNERKAEAFHKKQYTKQKLPPQWLQGTLK